MTAFERRLVDALAFPLVLGWRWFGPVVPLARRLLSLAKLRAWCTGPIPASTQFDGAVEIVGTGRLSLGESCRIGHGVLFETMNGGSIEIGSNVRINRGSVLVSYSRIVIGDDCLVGEYVSIRDVDHGIAAEEPMRLQPPRSSPIAVEGDSWIGRGSAVLKGTTIGAGSIVGANSVVTRDVPPRSLVAGAPARVIRSRDA